MERSHDSPGCDPAFRDPPLIELESWIEAARQGDREALGQALLAVRDYLFLVANEGIDSTLQGKGNASDIVQETYLQAQRGVEGFRGRTASEWRNWLRSILIRNLAKERRRFATTASAKFGARWRSPKQCDSKCARDDETPSRNLARREREAALFEGLKRLPEHYRNVVVWHHRERLSFDEIGRALESARRRPGSSGHGRSVVYARSSVRPMIGNEGVVREGAALAAHVTDPDSLPLLCDGEPEGDSADSCSSVDGAEVLRLLDEIWPHDDRDRPRAPQRFGRFTILGELGRGGFGVVYLAEDPLLLRRVALKVPRIAVLSRIESWQRFLRKARAASRLDHPNLIPLLEAGAIGPVGYIVSTFVAGPSLEQWLRQNRSGAAPRWAARLVIGHGARHGARSPTGDPPPRPQTGQRPAARARVRGRASKSAGMGSWPIRVLDASNL